MNKIPKYQQLYTWLCTVQINFANLCPFAARILACKLQRWKECPMKHDEGLMRCSQMHFHFHTISFVLRQAVYSTGSAAMRCCCTHAGLHACCRCHDVGDVCLGGHAACCCGTFIVANVFITFWFWCSSEHLERVVECFLFLLSSA